MNWYFDSITLIRVVFFNKLYKINILFNLNLWKLLYWEVNEWESVIKIHSIAIAITNTWHHEWMLP